MHRRFARFAATLSLAGVVGVAAAAPQRANAAPATITFIRDVGGSANAFNHLGYIGSQRAARELRLTLATMGVARFSDDVGTLTRAAKQSRYVVTVGPGLADALRVVAPRYPGVRFVAVDAAYSAPNVQGHAFDLSQGAYLAGVLAAGVSRRHAVGFVGGFDVPAIRAYLAAFQAGARSYDRKVRVVTAYTNSFMDPATGQAAGFREVRAGVDVIFCVADRAGLGAFSVAARRHIYSIGVESNQGAPSPRTALTTVTERVDTVTMQAIKRAASRRFRGGITVWNIKDDGVGLAPYHGLPAKVAVRVRAAIERARRNIAAGKITVPTRPTK